MQIPEGEYRVGTDDDYYVRTNVWSAPGCHGAACGAILHIKDGKFVDIEGDESNPITQGRLCIKCLNMTEFEYHPERIIYPICLLYTSPSPRDQLVSRMPSSA